MAQVGSRGTGCTRRRSVGFASTRRPWTHAHAHAHAHAPNRRYATRDDYGAALNATSAWAGLHYFASRATEERFEWPEGNGHIARRLLRDLTLGEAGDLSPQPAAPSVDGVAGSGWAAAGGRGTVRVGALVHRVARLPSGAMQVEYCLLLSVTVCYCLLLSVTV